MPVEAIGKYLAELIEESLSESGINRSDVIGLGLGIPGLVNIQRNQAIRISRLPEWNNVDIASYIEEHTQIGVSLHNDAHLLALMDKKQLRIGNESFIYIMHRTGVGSAVFIDGKLYDGMFGNSGYLGHTCVDIHGERCECGNRGCLELYCSRRAIIREYNLRAVEAGRTSCRDLAAIYDLSDAEDPLATEVLTRSGSILGVGIANMIKTFDIYRVVLGNVGCGRSNPFFKSVVRSAEECLKDFSLIPVRFDIGPTGEEASGLSGCYYVLSNFFNEPSLRIRT
jgi:predicted NBD/HSP70 family sugar kinase